MMKVQISFQVRAAILLLEMQALLLGQQAGQLLLHLERVQLQVAVDLVRQAQVAASVLATRVHLRVSPPCLGFDP